MSVEQRKRTLKEEIKNNRKRLAKRYLGYPWDQWPTYNSSIDDYEKTFGRLLHGTTIRELINNQENPVVIDLMSSTTAIADLFTNHPSSKKFGLAISLSDQREEYEKARGIYLNIAHIEGNLQNGIIWRKMIRLLNGRKASLILQRGRLGFGYLPQHPVFFASIANRLWDMLSPNEGILLAELYPTKGYPFWNPLTGWDIREEIANWSTFIKEQGIEVNFLSDVTYSESSAIFLRKHPDSPQKLPVFPS